MSWYSREFLHVPLLLLANLFLRTAKGFGETNPIDGQVFRRRRRRGGSIDRSGLLLAQHSQLTMDQLIISAANILPHALLNLDGPPVHFGGVFAVHLADGFAEVLFHKSDAMLEGRLQLRYGPEKTDLAGGLAFVIGGSPLVPVGSDGPGRS